MVVIRRELPRTRSAGLAGGRSHSSDEGSPFQVPPRPRSHRCHISGRLRRTLAFDLNSDRPDESEQFATHGRHDVLTGLAPRREAAVAVVQTVLGLPGNGFDGFTEMALAMTESGPAAGTMLIGPGGLNEHAPQVRVAGLRDVPAPDAWPAGMLAGDDAAITHELTGVIEARRRPDFRHDGGGRDPGDTAQSLQAVDEVAHRRGRASDSGVDGPLETRDAVHRVIDLGEVIQPRGFLRRMITGEGPEPVSKALCPRPHPGRRTLPVAKQELLQAMAGAQLVALGRFSRARTRSRRASWAASGTQTGVRSPLRKLRASFSASRRSVLMRSPAFIGTSVGATTTQLTPSCVSCQ